MTGRDPRIDPDAYIAAVLQMYLELPETPPRAGPYDRRIAEIYSRGGIVVEEIPSYRSLFLDLYQKIQKIVSSRGTNGLERTL